MQTARLTLVAAGFAVAGAVVSCGGAAPAPRPVPAPEPLPADAPAPPTTAALTPSVVAGSYRLRADIQRSPRAARGGGGGAAGQRSARAAPTETPLRLGAQPQAAPEPSAPAAAFGATVSIPGYTRAPRGRTGQAGAWWPIPGDSLVIQFASTAQQGAQVQLRGAYARGTIRGDVWLVTGSGTTFQLGTFAARRAGR